LPEAIGQTRGWFYSLLAVSVILFDRTPYRNVVSLGHIVDADGRKMSKSLGNALDPFELLDRYGADPLRWFMLAGGSPWVARRLGPKALEEVTRSFFLTLWNTHAFFTLYARLERGFTPSAGAAGGGHAGGAAGRPPPRGRGRGGRPRGGGTAGRDRPGGHRRPRRLRRHRRRPPPDRVRRRPLQLVRAPLPPPPSARRGGGRGGGRAGGVPDPVALPVDPVAAAGAVRPVRRRGAVAGAGGGARRPGRAGRPRRVLQAPGDGAGEGAGGRRPRAPRGHGRGAPAGRPWPPGPHRGQGEGAPAARQGPGDRRSAAAARGR